MRSCLESRIKELPMDQKDATTRLRYPYPEGCIYNRYFSDISVVLRAAILTILGSIETDSPAESEILRVVSHSTTEKK